MYKKLGLPDATVSLLHDYFEAFSNMYQVLPLAETLNRIIFRETLPVLAGAAKSIIDAAGND